MISDIDFDVCRGIKWRANEANRTGVPYVVATMRIGGRRTSVYLHRFITQCPPQYKVDHRDHDTLNNQRNNLRVSSHVQNNANREGWSESDYKGVGRARGKFRARIVIDGIETYLGCFASAVDAAMAYDAAAYKQFGEFAWLNFPEHYPEHSHDIVENNPPF